MQNVQVLVDGESTLVFAFETDGQVLELGDGRLVIDIAVSETASSGGFGSVIQTNPAALGTFSLRNTLEAALQNAGRLVSADSAYHAIVDSYATAADGRDPAASHCDDQSAEVGGPGLNGFPLQCGRLESLQFDNLDAWFPIAAVNRLDLAPADGSSCGQQRLIFANGEPIGNARMLLIVEAQIDNPNPACGVDACRPIAELWTSVAGEPDPFVRAGMLQDAFLGAGIGSGFGPFIHADRLGPNGGQIRTNNFNDAPWTLREFHFEPGPFGIPRPRPVGDSPNGALWDDTAPAAAGAPCRSAFLSALDGLLTDNLSTMSFVVPEPCKDAESRNDFSQDYAFHLQQGSGAFQGQLAAELVGTGLSPEDIAARARFAGSCMGCHQESSGTFLGNGVSAPFQFDFVHVNERITVPCDDGSGGCFAISEALRDEFLPHRRRVVSDVLASSGGCASEGGVPLAASALTPLSGSGPVKTLGGQIAAPHAH